MSKELFMEVRQSTSNHSDNGKLKFWKQQNADKKQLEHLKGNKQHWK